LPFQPSTLLGGEQCEHTIQHSLGDLGVFVDQVVLFFRIIFPVVEFSSLSVLGSKLRVYKFGFKVVDILLFRCDQGLGINKWSFTQGVTAAGMIG